MQQGGVSKATKTINLSEDIFAGMDFTLRGQRGSEVGPGGCCWGVLKRPMGKTGDAVRDTWPEQLCGFSWTYGLMMGRR